MADQLGRSGDVTLELSGTQVNLNPSNPIIFKGEGESDWSECDAKAKQRIEFEMSVEHELNDTYIL
ncbi:hypothetical protein M0R89_23225 (plasmid) [Halorussus limi]|uniref:Amphi-Trp domain-containing protein n=1 Tax=Halorussus limi TaxID=2938695 RepID=A0A8U0I1B5_9EURY|nr:hypothetical protein M0R89_23225 [Halorussus limi]